jgi:parvulin-like peptidyl-prolyl isomerase
MVAALPVRDREIHVEAVKAILPFLRDYQLVREIIIDRAIAPFSCTSEERDAELNAFYTANIIRSEAEFQTWLMQHQMSREKLIAQIDRTLRIEKFKAATWGDRLKSYFLQRKVDLDRVVFSMLNLRDEKLAQDLYFYLQEGTQSFAELAPQYSQGVERKTQGIIGPIELCYLHPLLKRLFKIMQVGQLCQPICVEGNLAIVRLEKHIPARLDEVTAQTLLQELFDLWLQEQLDLVV